MVFEDQKLTVEFRTVMRIGKGYEKSDKPRCNGKIGSKRQTKEKLSEGRKETTQSMCCP